eukprot:scaffold20738_cov66-Phaeocystis_antarctica.AAC.1
MAADAPPVRRRARARHLRGRAPLRQPGRMRTPLGATDIHRSGSARLCSGIWPRRWPRITYTISARSQP